MPKVWSIRAAVFIALSLSLPWRTAPAHGESGKLYRYTSSLPDGSGLGDELLFVSGSRVEVLSKQRNGSEGTLLVFEMGEPGLTPRTLKIWELSAAGRVFMGTIESLPSGKDVRVEVIRSGRPAETVAAPVYPWVMFNGIPVLSLAFAALAEPEEGFTVGLIRPSGAPNEPPLRFSGPIKLSYVGEEERGGVPTRKYSLEGEGVSGFAWAHREEKRLEAWETARTKIQLAGVEVLDGAGWEEAKRALLGPPLPKGPVEAVEVKPHPCRVPDYDQEVLCATYPVWENRGTKQGRKIGLNIVILPALGPDKRKDPVFELAGGPGQAITPGAGWFAQSNKLREKRDVVLVRQQKAACAVWPRGKATEDDHELVRSDLPVLLISGERDPVTPPESAEEASRYMANRLHVVVKRGSHSGGSECVEGLIRELVDRPVVQKLNASCAEKVYGPVVFMRP